MHRGGTAGALGDLAATLDADRFTGRTSVLDRIRRASSGEGHTRVFHVHGAPGVGKSALLRAAARRAEAAGLGVVVLRAPGGAAGPDPSPVAEEVDPAVADLVLVDDLDRSELAGELHRMVLASLPATTVVVTASRRAPAGDWLAEGLDRITAVVPLLPLDATESRELLARCGITDPAVADPIVTWALGYPAALAIAADRQGPGSGSLPPLDGPATPGHHVDDLLLERLGDDEFRQVDPDILDVAAIAPAVDARLLAAVLPGRATRSGLAALRRSRLSEPVGPRVTVHPVVRASRRRRLKTTDPERYRALVLGVSDHLLSRADTDGPRVLLELVSLIESPEASLGFEPSTTHYADIARPGDREALTAATADRGTAWFGRVGRWMDDHPEQVVTVRRTDGRLAAAAVVYTHATLPEWAAATVEVAPVVAHSLRTGHEESTLFLQDVLIAESPVDPAVIAEILRVGNAGALALSGIPVPRIAYVTSPVGEGGDLSAFGYVEVPELRRSDDERSLTTIVGDFGPGGMVAMAHEVIRTEQQGPFGAASAPGTWLVDVLRSFHDDDAVAAAAGTDADTARDALRSAVAVAFGDSPGDRVLRRALERTYLDPDGGPVVAQRDLFMSRSSLYRHLQRARRQLVERGPTGGGAPPAARVSR